MSYLGSLALAIKLGADLGVNLGVDRSLSWGLLGLESRLLAMHIPDGFLSWPISLWGWLLTIALLGLSLQRVQTAYSDRAVPLMGLCAAFIFAAQMINFPIPGGTSGHLLGGTLAGILLGPWAGALVMSVVFAVQAVMFQDGGLIVLGANIVNMGLIGTFGGYWLYRTLRSLLGRQSWQGMITATAITAWCSVVAGAIATALELAASGTIPLAIALPAMVSWHILIGVGEALITVAVVSYIWQRRPDLLFDAPRRQKSEV